MGDLNLKQIVEDLEISLIDNDGHYKSLYEVLQEISEKWNSMEETYYEK